MPGTERGATVIMILGDRERGRGGGGDINSFIELTKKNLDFAEGIAQDLSKYAREREIEPLGHYGQGWRY